jgi:hypothetical protein
MIQAIVVILSELYLLGLLVWRQEYLLFQLIVLTQLWVGLGLIPFFIRGETRLDREGGAFARIFLGLLVFALGVAVALHIENYWSIDSGFSESTKELLGIYAELLPVLAVAFMSSALFVTGFSRGRR